MLAADAEPARLNLAVILSKKEHCRKCLHRIQDRQTIETGQVHHVLRLV